MKKYEFHLLKDGQLVYCLDCVQKNFGEIKVPTLKIVKGKVKSISVNNPTYLFVVVRRVSELWHYEEVFTNYDDAQREYERQVHKAVDKLEEAAKYLRDRKYLARDKWAKDFRKRQEKK